MAATAVHGRSIAWTRDRCRLQGAYRSLLYAVATHADRHYGACSAGSRRLAASAGISATWVKRLLHELVDMGVLECLEPGAGRRAACYRFVPTLLDSGQPTSPQPSSVVGNSEVRSGQLGDAVVVTSPIRSGQLDAGPYRNEEKNTEEKNTEESASSAPSRRALDAGRADARPPVPDPIDIDGARYFPTTYQTRAQLLKHYVAEALHGGHPLTPNCMAADDGLCYMHDEDHAWPGGIPDDKSGQEQAGRVER